MRDPNNLQVFRKAHELAVNLTAQAARISARRHPQLKEQLQRAAASVPANIAEGCGHSSRREFARFLQVAVASCAEVTYHLRFAHDVGAISRNEHTPLHEANQEVRRMLAALLKVVRDELSTRGSAAAQATMRRRRFVP